jgi:hypothetical protein
LIQVQYFYLLLLLCLLPLSLYWHVPNLSYQHQLPHDLQNHISIILQDIYTCMYIYIYIKFNMH